MIGDHDPGTPVISPGFEKSHVVAQARTVVRYAKALNNSGSDVYLMLFDAATLPEDGAAPSRIPIPIPPFEVNGDEWPYPGTQFSSGCVIALSSTIGTLTLIPSETAWFDVAVWP
jgi:hypothetical protein